jgi:site-specific DNA recombinase
MTDMRGRHGELAQVRAREERERAVARLAEADAAERSPESWRGEDAVIYCRISHVKDQDQTSVERQERICRRVAERLGLRAVRVLIDPNRSAWKRDRKRPGWDTLLDLLRAGKVRHVLVYHPDRLMRQPWDLEELLRVSEDHAVILHGERGHRDLTDPDDRHFLRGEVAHACRSSDDTSRRLKDAMTDRARDGLPHTGERPYGYERDGLRIIEAEAAVIRDVFDRFITGETPWQIAAALNGQGIRTARGKTWDIGHVLSVLDNRHAAGIRVFRGTEIGPGTWEAILRPEVFAEARERRAYRSAVNRERSAQKFTYLLRGLLWCSKCGRRMSGKPIGASPAYLCGGFRHPDKEQRCYRKIGAKSLESFVSDAAISLLERLDVTGAAGATALLSDEDLAAIEADRAEIVVLKEMWDNQEIRTAQYREMLKAVEDRIKRAESKTIVRPAAEILEGMIGPGARATWEAHVRAGNVDRLNAVLRFLFAAVRIGESQAAPGRFDYGRIDIEQNPI